MIETRLKNKLFLSLVGFGLPLFVALLTIPWLIKSMGLEVFGLLSIGWTIVSFSGIFDLGLGRSLTKSIAKLTSENRSNQIWSLFRFSLIVVLFLSVFIFTIFHFFIPTIIYNFLNFSDSLRAAAAHAFFWLFLAIPVAIFSSLFISVLEGTGGFARVNIVRVLASSFIFIGPVIAWKLDAGIIGIMASLFIVRLLGLLGYVLISRNIWKKWHENYEQEEASENALKKELLQSGGWMAVSNILGPVMTGLDRLVIGSILSVAIVSYYATPVDMIMKLQVFTAALMSVVFPAFTASRETNGERVNEIFFKSVLLVGFVMFATTILAMVYGHIALGYWLGQDFADKSSYVLYWAAIGLFVNAFSFIPFALLQAIGRADITAKLNLIEVPFYFAFLYWALLGWGITGAALVGAARLLVNSILLFVFAGIYYPKIKKNALKSAALMVAGVLFLLIVMPKQLIN